MPRDPYGKRSKPTPKSRPALPAAEAETQARCPLCETGHVPVQVAALFEDFCRSIKERA